MLATILEPCFFTLCRYAIYDVKSNHLVSKDVKLINLSTQELRYLKTTLGYISHNQNLSLKEREEKTRLRRTKAAITTDIVGRFDWRNVQSNNYARLVQTQGLSGSCVAFGVCTALETRARYLQQVHKNSNKAYPLSSLSATAFFHQGANRYLKRLRGWDVEQALKYASTKGIPHINNHAPSKMDGKTIIQKYARLYEVDEMKHWITTKGPTITVFTMYLDLLWYRSGVYTPQNAFWNILLGGHCVAVMGFDDDKQAWLAQNSWGQRWGDAGYFYIGYNQCGFDALMWGIEDFKTIYQSNANFIN